MVVQSSVDAVEEAQKNEKEAENRAQSAKITTNAMARLGKNEDVRVEVLVKICRTLHCTLDDIVEILPEIKKEKPLPEIVEEEKPFDIPESWKWVRIQEITCLNPKNDLADELQVSFIPMALVDDGYRNNHTYEIKKWGEIKKGFTHFANEDIGIAKITPCFQNRKSVIFKD